MKSPQFLLGCAVVGFILSFLVGLISSVGLGPMLVRSFIFAFVSVLTGFGLRFVANKFLLPTADSLNDTTAQEKPAETVGEVVDITVEDDELPDDGSASTFVFQKPVFASQTPNNGASEKVVSSTESATSNSSVGAERVTSASASEEISEIQSFSPASPEVLTAAKQQDVQGVEDLPSVNDVAPVPEEMAGEAQAVEELEELEELPEIGVPTASQDDSGSASTSTSTAASSSSSAVPAGDSNSAEIAKAIRTVLLRDDS